MNPWTICFVLALALCGVLLAALAFLIVPRQNLMNPFTAVACLFVFAVLGLFAWPISIGVVWWENRTGKINETETKP